MEILESDKKPDFETALAELQQAVAKLESGKLTLEDSLRCFEEGVRLSRVCQQQLAVAEQKVETLNMAQVKSD
ncbi:MAG: exodeoxyribonuclease VII small subunit [Bdellovibrionales bacterium RIFOXYD1_FULL_53_11]|nr:MAG: exodeoxyribonuclease VII small subunit [Bdellovibrionales bacterium RIFOXYD1_FULL_53_11]